ncbi:MAG: APC family permease [Alphaproteobacteria bacterium]|nr:APC family permease [Alphaproteobacteria bacterium]
MKKESLSHFLFGKPLDPSNQATRKHIALVTLFAWIGLGADGISSSCYGPEEAFVALGGHTDLAIFLALATGITVFLISFSYLQLIELFPRGGGGYRVSSTLLGPYFGLVSGSALIVDYVLTIAISVASGVDALFSTISPDWQPYKILVEFAAVVLLIYLNLRRVKESIRVLMPIFLGFFIVHVILIVYGIASHSYGVGSVLPHAISESQEMADELGWFAVMALFFKAFSLGGGTYTGLESVPNSMHNFAEPKVRTGKNTMLCTAISLAFMATGIIMLYLLWGAERVHGQTLNATVFSMITADWSVMGVNISGYVVGVAMFLSAGLLFVAGNAGFLAGPAVLASMAIDRWMPHSFSVLSNRLVTKNGIVLMGVAALGALAITGGQVSVLVVLYSINVFLSFTLSLAGLCSYRWRKRHNRRNLLRMVLPLLGGMVCASILISTVLEKFLDGAWITIVITGCIIFLGATIKRHYMHVQRRVEEVDKELAIAFETENGKKPAEVPLDHSQPTAVFMVSGSSSSGLHTFLWVKRQFPGVFRNFVFVSVGEIDTDEFIDPEKWNKQRRENKELLKNYVHFCHCKGLAADYYHAYGTDVVETLSDLCDRVAKDFPKATFFATKLISENENFLTQTLHNQTAYAMQRRLHSLGKALIIMPMKL